MADRIYLKHERTGATTRLPEHMVSAAEAVGFVRVEDDQAGYQNEPEASGPEAEDLRDLTNEQLRERLADQGLPTSGNKDELVARLEENE